MKKSLYFFPLLLFVAHFACEKKSSSIYENCCGTLPTADEVTLLAPVGPITTGNIYIPNIFIPDTSAGATIDYFFLVFGNEGVVQIELFRLTSESGEVLHERTNFQASLANEAWDGLKQDGSLYYGSFNYEVKVEFVDGQKKTYTGKACSFKCGDADFPNDKLPDCFFTGQNNGNGAPDQSFPYREECF